MTNQTLGAFPVNTEGGITDLENLQNHLAQAAQVELSTVPLYLYSAYSIQTAGYSQWNPGTSAFRAIRSVVIEEMLHLCLARNLLVAIGGGDRLRCYDPSFVPKYPGPMLHREPELCLRLEPCTTKQMTEVFMPLELPAEADAPPQPHSYNTLGQFYAAIMKGFEFLDGKIDLWANNRPDLQYGRAYWNQDGGGRPIVVVDLKTAKQAIDTIVEQGEGAKPGSADVPIHPDNPVPGAVELSHYAKFKAIAEEIDKIGDVWPVPCDPKAKEFEGPVKELAVFFNAAYCYVLMMIDRLYETSSEGMVAGQPHERYGLERTFIAGMGGLLFPIADVLVRQPAGDVLGGHAAPTFEYHEFEDGEPRDELIRRCDSLLGTYPQLAGDDSVRQLLDWLPAVRPAHAAA